MTRRLDEYSSVRVAGTPILMTPGAEIASDALLALASSNTGRSHVVRLANAGNMSIFRRDTTYRQLFAASINLPDGKPLAHIVRLCAGHRLSPHVRGPDLFTTTLAKSSSVPVRHYFLGGSPGTLDRIRQRLASEYPNVLVAGSESPPFRELSSEEARAQIARIGDSKPHIIWIGLGTPKQDFEATRLAAKIPAVFVCVGAAFDFFARSKREAPPAVQALGMEWAFRLASEPRRLWRRYLFGNLIFLSLVIPDVVRALVRWCASVTASALRRTRSRTTPRR